MTAFEVFSSGSYPRPSPPYHGQVVPNQNQIGETVTTKHWWHCIDAFVPPSHITIPERRLYHACGSYTVGELQVQFFEIFDNSLWIKLL